MGAVTAAAFPVSGTVLTAAEYNKLPRGVVFYNTITANQNSISTVVDLTNFTATWTAVAGRLYRTTAYIPEVVQNTATGVAVFRLTDSTPTDKQFYDNTATANSYYTVTLSLIESTLSGSVTRKMRAATNAGTINALMSAATPGFIMVEDVGGT